MYFLYQAKTQLLHSFMVFEMQQQTGPDDGFRGGSDTSTDVLNTGATELSPEDQELVEKLEKELDGLKAQIEVEGNQQLSAYVNGLRKILQENPNEAEDEPEEMARLRGNIERLTKSLEAAQADAGKLREILMMTVKGDINTIETDIDALQGEENTDSYDKAHLEYSQDDIIILQESSSEIQKNMRETFFNFLGEVDDGKTLLGYKTHPKIQTLIKSHSDGFEYGYDVSSLLERFDAINPDVEEKDLQEQGMILASSVSEYQSISRDMNILLRDAQIVEGEKTLGEYRLEGTHEYYNSLMQSEDGKLTELGEKIASKNGNLPEFEDLGMDHVRILKEADVDMRMLFLSDVSGKRLEKSTLVEGKSYIVNFSINETLQNEMNFAYLDTTAKTIELNGEELTFKRKNENNLGVGYYDKDGNRVTLRDGSRVKILSMRDTSKSDVESVIQSEVQEKLNYYAQKTGEHRAFVEAAYGNPDEDFLGITFPKGIAGIILGNIIAMIQSYQLGVKLRYDPETRKIVKVTEDGSEGGAITNREVVGAYVGSMELGSLSAEYESGSSGPYAYNPNDNGAGPSYGSYQMNTDKGCYKPFARKHNIASGYEGWKAKIAEVGGPEAFHKLEHAYIKETHFDVMMSKVTVSGKENFTLALQNVVWSSAVQHGPHKTAIIDAINRSGVIPGDTESEAKLINTIYNIRGKLYPAGISSRYNKERVRALQMLNSLSIGGIVAEGSIYDQNLGVVPDNFQSSPFEKNPSTNVTLCSKTARINLSRLGIRNVHQGSSARNSFEKYPSARIQSFPPTNTTDAKVADFYLDASSRNAEYGHRVAAFNKGGQWYVLDPYYANAMSRTGKYDISGQNSPILASDYVRFMREDVKGAPRKIWGAAYFK